MLAKIDRLFLNNSYLIFLLALVCWIGINPMIDVFLDGNYVSPILLTIIDLSALYLIYADRKRMLALSLAIPSIVLLWLGEHVLHIEWLLDLGRMFHLVLFFAITVHLVRKIFKSKVVDEKVIFASISGYIMLSLMASILCWFLHSVSPEAYNFQASERIIDYSYYSIVTMSTLGYGDITPLTEASRSLAVFITLVGQFYMTVLVAMLVGKFISQKSDH